MNVLRRCKITHRIELVYSSGNFQINLQTGAVSYQRSAIGRKYSMSLMILIADGW
jgi:hypothetical protein